MKNDNCKGCKVPERMEYMNPFDYDDYFECSMCSCYRCEYLHNCDLQCAEERGGKNE